MNKSVSRKTPLSNFNKLAIPKKKKEIPNQQRLCFA
jgi:hypothetical protein